MLNITPNTENLIIHPSASISETARIQPSERGSKIIIGAHCQIYDYVVIKAVGGSGDIVMEEHCYINAHSTLYTGNGIQMGNYVLIAPGCVLAPTNHSYQSRSIPIRHQGFLPSKGGIVIEDDVWIGANCTILDGTLIRHGAVIAAGSVVMGEIGAFQIWGGVPAKFIRDRPNDLTKPES